MKTYQLLNVERSNDKCHGTDYVKITYQNWQNGIETIKKVFVKSPKVIRLELTEFEIEELINTLK